MEAAMILVACCPGGSLSNVVTHIGRGNTALSVTISAVAALLALVLTPLNFSWMVTANPGTAGWLRSLQIDPRDILFSLLAILAVPMLLGLAFAHRLPGLMQKIRKPLANLSLALLLLFIAAGLYRERQLLDVQILLPLLIVVLHNASGLIFGWLSATAMRVAERDRRAVMIEGGMQNSGLALGIIALQFGNDLNMVIIASLWGIWHIVSGLSLAVYWRKADTAQSLA
jgi:BASS family bile acid:Na+ symporter